MKKQKIIIADDEPAYGQILKNELKKAGYSVTVVKNGEELLNIVYINKPNLILLDLLMPKKSGVEVLSEIRKNQNNLSFKVVILTNLSYHEDIEKIKKLGIDDFFIKSDQNLYAIISKVKAILI